LRQIFFLEDLRMTLLDLLANGSKFLRTQEFRQILVGTFADMLSQLVHGKRLAEMAESSLPREHVRFVGINDRSVEIEYYSLNYG
jgi:hypothetical protein